jgi:hypothetical protein
VRYSDLSLPHHTTIERSCTLMKINQGRNDAGIAYGENDVAPFATGNWYQYSTASMMVSTRVVTAGSANSGAERALSG